MRISKHETRTGANPVAVKRLLGRFGLSAALLAATASVASSQAAPSLRTAITNVVVIYQENWSFDSLYGSFPGANGIARGASTTPQKDKVTGAAITTVPQPLAPDGKPDPAFPAELPAQPYDLAKFVAPTKRTGDIVHRFYQQQSQIDGGKMAGFVSWSDNPGLVFSYADASNMPEGLLAKRYTMADNFFHSAFGGSYLNHAFLICACAPQFPNAPPAAVATLDGNGRLALTPEGKISHDGFVSPDGYAINTAFTVNVPHPANVPAANLLPNQTAPTIGERLSAANVSWKWYSGGWNDALSGNPDPLFQYHHQAFAFFAPYADGTPAKAQHLQDELNFFDDIRTHRLPQVVFIKPLGVDNEHPGYAALMRGQEHVLALVDALRNSPYWAHTAVIITYDENGGRWDHVPPPKIDRWGPGTRVPTIVVSPYAKRGVDHTQYETVSILALIEKRFGLRPLGTRDANANPLTNAFDFTKLPVP